MAVLDLNCHGNNNTAHRGVAVAGIGYRLLLLIVMYNVTAAFAVMATKTNTQVRLWVVVLGQNKCSEDQRPV